MVAGADAEIAEEPGEAARRGGELGEGLPPHAGYEYILSRVGRDFDPEVVEVFRTSVAPHPPGTGVILSDGYCGIVKEVRPGMVTSPIVRLITDAAGECLSGREIDLAKLPGITIVSTAFDPWASAVG